VEKEDKLAIIQDGIDLEEMKNKSRGWFVIEKYIERIIKGNFEKMLKEDANDFELKGGIKIARKIKNYPNVIIDKAKRAKKRLNEEAK